jgi:hypothetical protein
MLVEVQFVRDARSITQIAPDTVIEPDAIVVGAFVRTSRAVFTEGIITGGVTAIAFTDLTDVPHNYSGQAGRLASVKTDESGLEFVTPLGGGNFSSNTTISVPNEIVLFADTTGRLGKRSTGDGIAKLTSGVLGFATEGADYLDASRISDAAYDPSAWDGDTGHAPSKNAVRDKIESMGSASVSDAAYDPTTWDGVTTVAPSKNAVRDKIESMAGGGAITANQKSGGLSFSAYKSAGLATGKIRGYWVAPYSGTIVAWNLTVDAGTLTIKVWKIATGTAHPTNANSINTSGVSLSTGTSIRSTNVTDFTTVAVAAGDILAVEITAVSGVTEMSGGIEIQKT